MTDGLTERDRQGILSVLEAFPKIRRAVLFGSRAIGTFRGASDLDLAIEGDDLKLTDLVAVRSRIGRLDLPFEADIVIRAKITNLDVETHIRRYGQVFYERKTTSSNLSEWRNVALGDVVDFRNGKAISPERYTVTGKYPVFGSNGQIARSDDVLNSDPVIVIGRVGAYCGCVHYVSQASWVTDNAIIGLPKDGNDVRYLFYLLSSLELQRTAIGSAQPLMTQGGLKVVRATVPSPTEQRAIASILGALDDKIELNRQMNETLEALAQSIFKNWFVDAAATKLPKGWRETTLGEIIELAYGQALKAENRQPGEIPVFGSNGQVGWHNTRLVDGPGIVVGRKGNPGIVTWSPTDFFPIDTAFYVVPKSECRSMYFLFYALRGHNLASLGADSAVPGLNRNMAYLSKQLVPPVDVLNKFDAVVKPLFQKIHTNDEESRTLAALRDALLPKLLSGELRIQQPIYPCN